MKNPTAIPDTAKFPLGRIVSTPGALDACTSEYLRECLLRHIQGDWGVVSADDAAENDLSLKQGSRLRSIRPIRTKAISGSLPRPIAAPRPSFCRASIDRTY